MITRIFCALILCICGCSKKNLDSLPVAKKVESVCEVFERRAYYELFGFLPLNERVNTDSLTFAKKFIGFDSLSYVQECLKILSVKSRDSNTEVKLEVVRNMHPNTNPNDDGNWDRPLSERRYLDTSFFVWTFDKNLDWLGFKK